MQIENKIHEFIVKNLYYAEDNSIADEDSFLETGVIDSMGVMELVAFIQSDCLLWAQPYLRRDWALRRRCFRWRLGWEASLGLLHRDWQ